MSSNNLSGSYREWIDAYCNYLTNSRGLSDSSVRVYARIAAKLLERIGIDGKIDWRSMNAEMVSSFVLEETHNRSGHVANTVTTSVRSFLRFLVFKSAVRSGLELAIPRIRFYRHKGLPKHLDKSELNKLLKYTTKADFALRNTAILLLLSKFGMRAAEVAALDLTDIDWSNGTIIIRHSKTRRERTLPLLKSVGEAILNYLENGRPSGTGSTKIFLGNLSPHGPIGANCISKMVGRRILNSGIRQRMCGAHILRHSVATRLINHGASFKEIADLLGHRRIDSTAGYAKVNLASLADIGLPWPGGNHQ